VQVLDDGTRHLPFQAEAERERDKQESEIWGPDRLYASSLLKDVDRSLLRKYRALLRENAGLFCCRSHMRWYASALFKDVDGSSIEM